MTDDWRELEAKFTGKCILCGSLIEAGEKCKWKQGSGIRHTEECIEEGLREDNSRLDIIDDNFIWKDPRTHTKEELEKIKECQRCGKPVFGDIYNNVDRRTCEDCFLK